MKRSTTFLSSMLLAASVVIPQTVNAAGMIIIDPAFGGVPIVRPPVSAVPIGRPGVTPRPTRPLLKGGIALGLRLQGADVKVDITDQVAKTYITQTFVNDSDRQLAGTYLFPLPEDTTFSSFSLHIDGKPVEGKILEAQEARQTYEAIVRSMVDPGLLEYADYKTVRARIFPIPAHGTKKVELEYTQVLKADNGLLKYRFPLKTESESPSADDIKINVKINSKQNLKTIWSPSHAIASTRDDDHRAKISYNEKDAVQDKDFLLYYSVSDKDMTANLINHKNVGEDGYYMLTLSPPVESKQAIGKDIVMVADTSGSMQGERMEQNKKALKYFVNALNPTDRFSIIEFNTDVEPFKSTLVTATPENKKAALSFIEDLEARGGTNIGDALKTATTMLEQDTPRPGYLLLMTDGEPTVGETSVNGLLKAVEAKRDIRVFDFGVGYEVNTRLLNKLAEQHHGTSEYVEPGESLETALSSFYEKIKAPVLSNVKITYEGIQVKDTYPRAPKDIFAGTQLLMLGRYKGAGQATVKLTGTVNGVPKAYSFPLAFSGQEAGHTYLPRLWAMRRIGNLTEVAQENGNTKEVVDEIIALSKKHGIISAYTSFLVTEPGREVPRPMPMVGFRGDRRNRFVGAVPMGGPVAAPAAPAGGAGVRSGFLPQVNMGRFVHQAGDSQYAANIAARDKEESAAVTRVLGSLHSNKAAGKDAVVLSKNLSRLKESNAVASNERQSSVKTVDDKIFYLKDGFWTDSAMGTATKPIVVNFGSKEYFDLLKLPGVSKYLAVGKQVMFTYKGQSYKVVFSATDA